MKHILLLGLALSVSCASYADFVYMKEDSSGKSVKYQSKEEVITLNESRDDFWALYPDVTPDGNEFIYTEGKDESDLHLAYYNKKKNQRTRFLPQVKGMVLHPKFTKNGKWIFYSAPATNGKNTIYYFNREDLMGRQGRVLPDYSLSFAKVLVEGEESYFPRPSSDGNFVVYQRNTAGKKEIVFYDRVENEKKVLAEGMSPALSFDERLVAFTSKKDGNWNVYVIDRTTLKLTQITSDAADEMAPTFLPDNSIAFASNKSGHFRLYHLKGDKWNKIVDLADDADVELYSPQFTGDIVYKQKTLSPFIGNPRSSFGTASVDGKLYMCGGHQGHEHTYPPESFSNQFIVYDSQANEWKELAPRPAKAHGYQIVAHGNYIYAFGGFAYAAENKPQWKSLDQIDRYDIKANKWETVGKLFSPRSSNVAIKIDDKVYLAAGWDSTPKFANDLDGTFLDTVEIFDLKTEKVELASYKITPVRRALTGVAYKGKMLLVGGIGQGASHFDLSNRVTLIDPHDGTAEELAPLPFATFAPAAEVLGNELMVFGGMFKTGDMAYEYVSHIYSMDLTSQKWRHTGRYLQETKGFSQVFHLNDKTLGILGGHHYFEGNDTPVNTFETITK